jgi:parallel beta-helix repeat protein
MRIRHSLFPLAPMALLAVAALLLPTSSQALQTFCVSNVSQLNTAWQAADDDDVVINLVVGTYSLAGSCLDASSYCAVDGHDITIRGGYANGCQAVSSDLPSSTTLTLPSGVIRMGSATAALFAPLTLSRLAIRNADAVTVRLENATSSNYSFEMTRVWLDRAPMQIRDVDRVFAESNLVTRASAASLADALQLTNVDRFTIRNNTFADNLGVGLRVPNGEGLIANNIFWNNAGAFDMRVLGADAFDAIDVVVKNNVYASGRLDVLGIWGYVPSGQQNVDPLFVNPAALDYRISNTSQVINTGLPYGSPGAGGDHDGGARWIGEAPDRGAYESPIGSTATTLVVTNTLNSGNGSLRQAIIDANAAPNVNRIEFAIGSSCGPRVITLLTALPDITGPVVIDGYTQPGAARNTQDVGSNAVRCIILDGSNANGVPSTVAAIVVDTGSDAPVTIDGLAFGGFALYAVNFLDGEGHAVYGSQFGGTVGSLTLVPNINGMQIGDVTGAQIGRRRGRTLDSSVPHPANLARNIFADSVDAGIVVGSAAIATEIGDNYIGIGPNGSSVGTGNRDGIRVLGRSTEIRHAVISNNDRHGIHINSTSATGTEVRDSRIGLPIVCVLGCDGYGNGEDGVRIEGGAARNRLFVNTIAFNGDDGIVITNSIHNTLYENAIYENGEQPIDLGDDGTTANGNNSVPAPPGAGNSGQNRPAISRAEGTATLGVARGTLGSRNGQYRIDFYGADSCPIPFPLPSASGSPRIWLGAGIVEISNGTASADGSVSFALPIATSPPSAYFTSDRLIMATATRLNVLGPTLTSEQGTSELSGCARYDALLFADGFEAL